MKPYYADKWTAIYHGDCREILPQLQEPICPDCSSRDYRVNPLDNSEYICHKCGGFYAKYEPELILTDPPYVGLKGNQKYMNNTGVSKHYTNNSTVGDIWDASTDWFDLIKPKYGLMVFCQFHDVDAIAEKAIGYKRIALITWYARNSPPSVQNRPHFTTNFIWCFEKESGLKWRSLETMYDIPKLATGCMASERFVDESGCAIHPTQKPQQLISELLKVDAQTILDPFLGSGTTCYCAKKLNRYSIGIEIEEKYCEIAAKRCSQEVMELGL